jgi:hypothetical protein
VKRVALPLVILLALAVSLRVAVVATTDAHKWFAGGDGPWYVRQGWLLAHDALPAPLRTVGPIYPLVLAAIWRGWPGHADPAEPLAVSVGYLTTVRLLQSLVGTLTVAIIFVLSRRLELGRGSALLAAAGVGLGPAFVLEPFFIRTETIFIGLLALTVCVHVGNQRRLGAGRAALTGILVALAALTRPILLPFPAVLALDLWWRSGLKRGARLAATLLLASTATTAPWQVWLYRGTGGWLPEGFSANLMLGARGEHTRVDREAFHALEKELQAAGRGYLGEAARVIAEDPLGWAGRRGRDVLAALAQTHGTSDLGGPSVKAAVASWFRDDRTADGLWRIASQPAFPLKLAVYAFHYGAAALAVVGMLATWPRRRAWAPVYAVIAYLVLAHGLLTVLPRYLFPAEAFLWVLAGAGLAGMRSDLSSRRPAITSSEPAR